MSLDRLTKINEIFGYRFGNLLLQATVKQLTKSISNEDKVAYLSGNKFAVILAGAKTKQDALGKVNHLLDCLNQIVNLEDREILVTVSIGITFYPDNGTDLENLLQQANSGMNYAKKQGGNRLIFYCGMLTIKVVPTPTWLLTEISPPCRSTAFLTIVSPNPVPAILPTFLAR